MGNKNSIIMGNKNSTEDLHYNNKRSSSISVHPNLSNTSVVDLNEKFHIEHRDLKLCFNEENHTDKQEIHYLLKRILFQCEFSSPVREKLIKGGKVLDLGCGYACFLLDVAEQYPNSKFIGVDIDRSVFPKTKKHKNLKFKNADIFERLPFPDNEFDLVNMGSMVFCITPKQLNFLIGEMIRVCKPNGYIEFDETHMTQLSKGVGENFGRLLEGFQLVAKSYGADNDMAMNLPTLLSENTAFTSVNVANRKRILGPNGGNFGKSIQYVFEWFDHSSEQFVNDFCRIYNTTKEQYKQLVYDTEKEITYTFPEVEFIRVYAQKKQIN